MSDTQSFDSNAECQINDNEIMSLDGTDCACGPQGLEFHDPSICVGMGGNWSELPDPDYSNKFEGTPLDPYVKNAIVGNFKLPWSAGHSVFNFLKDSTGGKVVLTYENGTEDFIDEHLHFCLWDSKIKPDTLKAYIRKCFPCLVGDGKGGDKKYQAKFAKELIQLLYIFKERKTYDTNIDFLMEYKNQTMNYYASQYVLLKQTFSKCPAGRFYEWLHKNKTTWVQEKNWEKGAAGAFKQPNNSSYYYTSRMQILRAGLIKFVTEYAKDTNNPNPGFPYCCKLINYCHLHLDEDSYQTYIYHKQEKDAS